MRLTFESDSYWHGFFQLCSLYVIWIMKLFSFLKICNFSHLFSCFFADVSKKRRTRYLKNGSTDFPDFFTQTFFWYYLVVVPRSFYSYNITKILFWLASFTMKQYIILVHCKINIPKVVLVHIHDFFIEF